VFLVKWRGKREKSLSMIIIMLKISNVKGQTKRKRNVGLYTSIEKNGFEK